MKDCTRKLRNLEASTIGGFVQKALSDLKSAEAKVEQGPGDVFSTVEREIGTVGQVEGDILRRLASLRREVEALK